MNVDYTVSRLGFTRTVRTWARAGLTDDAIRSARHHCPPPLTPIPNLSIAIIPLITHAPAFEASQSSGNDVPQRFSDHQNARPAVRRVSPEPVMGRTVPRDARSSDGPPPLDGAIARCPEARHSRPRVGR